MVPCVLLTCLDIERVSVRQGVNLCVFEYAPFSMFAKYIAFRAVISLPLVKPLTSGQLPLCV